MWPIAAWNMRFKYHTSFGRTFDQTLCYDRNIRFIDNKIKTFDNRIVWADRVDGLIISGNEIEQTNTSKSLYRNAHQFELINCNRVEISNNTYKGTVKHVLKTEGMDDKKVKINANKGFSKFKS